MAFEVEMKVFFITIFIYFSHLSAACGASEDICRRIKAIYVAGEGDKYSVPLSDSFESPISLKYEPDINQDGEVDSLVGWCGNGYGAICDFEMKLSGGKSIQFVAGYDVRLINIGSIFYIVNGVSESQKKTEFAKWFSVNRLGSEGMVMICDGDK